MQCLSAKQDNKEVIQSGYVLASGDSGTLLLNQDNTVRTVSADDFHFVQDCERVEIPFLKASAG